MSKELGRNGDSALLLLQQLPQLRLQKCLRMDLQAKLTCGLVKCVAIRDIPDNLAESPQLFQFVFIQHTVPGGVNNRPHCSEGLAGSDGRHQGAGCSEFALWRPVPEAKSDGVISLSPREQLRAKDAKICQRSSRTDQRSSLEDSRVVEEDKEVVCGGGKVRRASVLNRKGSAEAAEVVHFIGREHARPSRPENGGNRIQRMLRG